MIHADIKKERKKKKKNVRKRLYICLLNKRKRNAHGGYVWV